MVNNSTPFVETAQSWNNNTPPLFVCTGTLSTYMDFRPTCVRAPFPLECGYLPRWALSWVTAPRLENNNNNKIKKPPNPFCLLLHGLNSWLDMRVKKNRVWISEWCYCKIWKLSSKIIVPQRKMVHGKWKRNDTPLRVGGVA